MPSNESLKNFHKTFTGAVRSWASHEHSFLIFIAGALGIICGLLAVLFDILLEWSRELFFGHTGSYFGSDSLIYMYMAIPIIPAVGGLIVGFITWYFKMGYETASAAEVMKWAAVDGGQVKPGTVWFRLLATSVFLGSGGSGGREGPIAQICGAMGSAMGQFFKMSTDRLRLLVGCGAAAGIAATFNAPIAGVIFTVELVLGDFNVISFLPIVISSVMATTTKRLLLGDVPAFVAPSYSLVSYWEIILYFFLGIICGLVCRLFFVSYFWAESYFEEDLKIHPILKPAVGGLVVGLIGAFLPQVFGGGYDVMGEMLNGDIIWYIAIALIFFKIIATSIALGSGGSGGMFAPALFIGCMTGGVFGTLAHAMFPESTATAGAYAMVGVGAVMAAAAHAPLTNILMGYELTGNYLIILPVMTACIMSTYVMTRFTDMSLYTEKLNRRGIQLWRGRDRSVMDKIKVSDVMRRKVTTIPENLPFGTIMELIANSRDNYYPVVDTDGKMTGVVSMQNVREIMLDSDYLCNLVVAKEIATEDVITVHGENNLNEAMEKFSVIDIEQLPVVSVTDPRSVVGMLSRMDVIAAYKKEVLKKSTKPQGADSRP